MTKQLKDIVLECISGEVTVSEYEEIKMILEDYDDLNKDYLELKQKLAEWE